MKYIIKFQIFGKKMRYVVEANSKLEAEKLLRDKLTIDSISTEEEKTINDKFAELMNKFVDNMDEFFDELDKSFEKKSKKK